MHRGAGSTGTGSAGSAVAAAVAGGSGSGQHGVDGGVGGYDMMSEDEQQPRESAADAALKGAAKRTRVEGRGSSAAQRAAASEACKSISLERLQAQYHRPLSEVARDLKVSVARLLKKCREFGILRWPYRHVRSVQESFDQLEKDKQAATDEMATDDMELRLRLLRRRGELVAHFASCWLESDMRKGIFLADPRDVDSMLATAHEAHGRRRVPPPGWETLGRFPEMAVREHFLEQMRTYMIGGGTATSPDSDSPHRTGQRHSIDTSSSSVEDTRERLRQQQMQQQQQQQRAYGDGALQAPWQHQRPQQYPNPLPPWQGASSHLYGGGGGGGGGGGVADQGNLAHSNQCWGSGSGAAPASMSAGAGGVLAASDYGRLRAPSHGGEYPRPLAGGQAPSSLGYAPGSWQSGQPSAAASPATLGGGHRQSGDNNNNSNVVVGGDYFSGAAAMHGVRGGDQREGQLGGNVWGEGGGSGAAPRDSIAGGDGGGPRDMWRPPERQTAQAAAAQRGWVTADLANPPRGEFPPGGGGGGGGGAGGSDALPSIFQMSQQRAPDREPLSSFSSGAAGASGATGGGLRGTMGGGSDASGGAAWEAGGGAGGGLPQDQAMLGGFDHRWGDAAAVSVQLQQQQALGQIVSNARWQDTAAGDGGGGGGGGSRMDGGIPRAGSFDHVHGGSAAQGRHRGTERGGGPEGQA